MATELKRSAELERYFHIQKFFQGKLNLMDSAPVSSVLAENWHEFKVYMERLVIPK